MERFSLYLVALLLVAGCVSGPPKETSMDEDVNDVTAEIDTLDLQFGDIGLPSENLSFGIEDIFEEPPKFPEIV